MNRPPTFRGKQPTACELDDFLDDFTTFCIANRIEGQQKIDLFDSLIRQPAKQEYDAALADDQQMRWPAPLGNNPAPQAVADDLRARLYVRTTWLHNQYQGPCQYQAV
jgi:hypothetical protein